MNRSLSGNYIPLFRGPIPRREDIVFDEPTFIPSLNDRPLLVWRGYAYKIKCCNSGGRMRWICARRPCKGAIYTKRYYPCGAADVDRTSASQRPHSCAASEEDIFTRRAQAEIKKRGRESSLPLKKILDMVLSKEPDYVQMALAPKKHSRDLSTADFSAIGKVEPAEPEERIDETISGSDESESREPRNGDSSDASVEVIEETSDGSVEVIEAKQEAREDREEDLKSSDPPGDERQSSATKMCTLCCLTFPAGCGANFRLHLDQELEIYRGKRICPECRFDCPTPIKMIDHFFSVHGGLKKFVCGVTDCVEAFWIEGELKSHARNEHR